MVMMMIRAKIYHQDDTWIWTLGYFSLLFSEKSKYLAIWLGIFLTPLSSPFVIILQLRCLFLRKSDVLLSPTRGQMTEVLFSCQNTHQLAANCQALIILLILVSIASTGGGVLFSIEEAKFGPILAILSQIYALFGVFCPWCCTKIN